MTTLAQKNAELEAKIQRLEAAAKAQQGGLLVKTNASGGVFIRHSSFKAWSENKQKEYTAGINMNMAVAKALFGNPELCKEISEQVMAL